MYQRQNVCFSLFSFAASWVVIIYYFLFLIWRWIRWEWREDEINEEREFIDWGDEILLVLKDGFRRIFNLAVTLWSAKKGRWVLGCLPAIQELGSRRRRNSWLQKETTRLLCSIKSQSYKDDSERAVQRDLQSFLQHQGFVRVFVCSTYFSALVGLLKKYILINIQSC